jgi:hypothetical protein
MWMMRHIRSRSISAFMMLRALGPGRVGSSGLMSVRTAPNPLAPAFWRFSAKHAATAFASSRAPGRRG